MSNKSLSLIQYIDELLSIKLDLEIYVASVKTQSKLLQKLAFYNLTYKGVKVKDYDFLTVEEFNKCFEFLQTCIFAYDKKKNVIKVSFGLETITSIEQIQKHTVL